VLDRLPLSANRVQIGFDLACETGLLHRARHDDRVGRGLANEPPAPGISSGSLVK
jgi:hypothetical protein